MFLADLKVGQLRTNCYIIADDETRECAVIDPGDDYNVIIDTLNKNDFKPTYILLTHGHFDHILEANRLRESYNAKVICHEEAEELLLDNMLNGGFFDGISVMVKPDEKLKENDIIKLGNMEIKVLHVPGHAPGSACYYIKSENIIFSGDTLFKDTIGITDIFPYGNHELLVNNIKEKLLTLPPETVVYPGHGAHTNIASEIKFNTFLK